MREVGDVARTTLQEVRAAVAGYRRPTLTGELRSAAEILAAAGIAYRQEGESLAVPAAVEAVCLRCLHRNPARRYATAAAVASDLRTFLKGAAPRRGK